MFRFQAAIDRNTIASLSTETADVRRLLADKEEQLVGIQAKFALLEANSVDKSLLTKLESRVTELDRALGLERSLKLKCENQLSRMKSQLDRSSDESQSFASTLKMKEDQIKKLTNQVRDLKDDLSAVEVKLEQSQSKKYDLVSVFNSNYSNHCCPMWDL